MYEQVYEPIAGNLALSTLVAVIPILVLFVLVYGMPIDLALNSPLLGFCFGLFPIVWIVINAMFPEYEDTRVAI